MSISKSIKKIRKHWRLTQTEFGDEFGLSRIRVMNYESGTSDAPVEFLVALELKSGVTVRQMHQGGFSLEGVPLRPGDFSVVPAKAGAKATAAAGDVVSNSTEFQKLAEAVEGMQLDMEKLKKVFDLNDEAERKKLDVFVAMQTVISYLEEGMDDAEYKEEKKEYLARLAALLSEE